MLTSGVHKKCAQSSNTSPLLSVTHFHLTHPVVSTSDKVELEDV